MWLVYILRLRDNSLYTGMTNDMTERLATHTSGKGSKFVRSRLPCTLVHQETFETRGEALRREHEIKQFSKTKKELLIHDSVLIN